MPCEVVRCGRMEDFGRAAIGAADTALYAENAVRL